jgi:hypothetical protein
VALAVIFSAGSYDAVYDYFSAFHSKHVFESKTRAAVTSKSKEKQSMHVQTSESINLLFSNIFHRFAGLCVRFKLKALTGVFD